MRERAGIPKHDILGTKCFRCREGLFELDKDNEERVQCPCCFKSYTRYVSSITTWPIKEIKTDA